MDSIISKQIMSYDQDILKIKMSDFCNKYGFEYDSNSTDYCSNGPEIVYGKSIRCNIQVDKINHINPDDDIGFNEFTLAATSLDELFDLCNHYINQNNITVYDKTIYLTEDNDRDVYTAVIIYPKRLSINDDDVNTSELRAQEIAVMVKLHYRSQTFLNERLYHFEDIFSISKAEGENYSTSCALGPFHTTYSIIIDNINHEYDPSKDVYTPDSDHNLLTKVFIDEENNTASDQLSNFYAKSPVVDYECITVQIKDENGSIKNKIILRYEKDDEFNWMVRS